MRDHHKSVLASLRASSEDRRARSPSLLSLRSQKSVLSDAELDEDGDMPFPPGRGTGLRFFFGGGGGVVAVAVASNFG